MAKFGVGQPVLRAEDPRFLTGRGRYTDDLSAPGHLFAQVLRSPYAHAAITRLDVSAARRLPGVLAIYTEAELAADGVGTIPCKYKLKQSDGSLLRQPPRPALARGRVRFVGDPVALVVAETIEAARDAAELIEVDYDPLDAVVETARALDTDVPQIWDEAPGNLCFDWDRGDREKTEAAFRRAAKIISLTLVNNRVVPNAMEGRAAMASVDPGTRVLTLTVTSQGAHDLRDQLAKDIFHLPPEAIRVITPDVGGGFGMKIFNYPEYVLVCHAARNLGRPVKWASDRTEAFLSDIHGRDHVTRAELAVDEIGRFLAFRVDTVANLGAYLSNFASFIPTGSYSGMIPGVYPFEAVHIRVRGAFTNTAPVDAYRGAGRPEAAYCLERMVDFAAAELGVDPAELRRRNFISPEAMPYRTATGNVYDTGDFGATLEAALGRADQAGFEARRAEAKARGKLRGFGFASYIEACSGGGPEEATIEMAADGSVTVLIGTQSNGQGHDTAYRQLVVERLGVPFDAITVLQGDTGRIAWGSGTGGSRSGPVGGAALSETAKRVLERATETAADLLEAAAADIRLADGVFEIVGTDRRATWAEVAGKAAQGQMLAFQETQRWKPPASTFPNGTHVCEVEIDPDTGVVTVERYTVVDDFGTLLNPSLVAGQVHGGVAQGVGQALYEMCHYDAETGQLLTASLNDYGVPRADHLPLVDLSFRSVPSTTNALGMKGAGEAGSIGAPPAVINAVVDALKEYGVKHIDMPATPEKVWRLIQRREA